MADSKMVPREPTAEMIDAGPDDLTSDEKRRAWQAMYDAAPAAAADENARLREALRDMAVDSETRYCFLCRTKWVGKTERHASGCLASPTGQGAG